MAGRKKACTSKSRNSQPRSRHTNTSAMRSHPAGSDRYWSGNVNSVSTFPPKDIFTKDAKTIARSMASKKVSPKGLGDPHGSILHKPCGPDASRLAKTRT